MASRALRVGARRCFTAAGTAAGALSGVPAAKGGAGAYSRPSWLGASKVRRRCARPPEEATPVGVAAPGPRRERLSCPCLDTARKAHPAALAPQGKMRHSPASGLGAQHACFSSVNICPNRRLHRPIGTDPGRRGFRDNGARGAAIFSHPTILWPWAFHRIIVGSTTGQDPRRFGFGRGVPGPRSVPLNWAAARRWGFGQAVCISSTMQCSAICRRRTAGKVISNEAAVSQQCWPEPERQEASPRGGSIRCRTWHLLLGRTHQRARAAAGR
jgi:hypothetical protein